MATLIIPKADREPVKEIRLQIGKEWVGRSTSGEFNEYYIRSIVLEMLAQLGFPNNADD